MIMTMTMITMAITVIMYVIGDAVHIRDAPSSSNNVGGGAGRRKRRRRKRSHSVERHVEVLVAVDVEMRRYHGHNLEHYILTLMAIVTIAFSVIF